MRWTVLTIALTTVAAVVAAPARADHRAIAGAACVSHLSAVASGTLYGAGDCGKGIVVSRRLPGAGWQQVSDFWPADLRVEDVAADEVATFVVLSRAHDRPATSRSYLIGKLLHGSNRLSALTTLGHTDAAVDSPSVVARAGRWAVAFTRTSRSSTDGSLSSQIFLRKTIGGAAGVEAAPGERAPREPALALRGDGFLLAFTAGDQRRVLRTSRAGADGRFSPAADHAPATGDDAAQPQAVVSGGTEVLAWIDGDAPVLSLGSRRRELPRRGAVQRITLDASGGSAFVTTAERFPYAGGVTERVYARDVGFTGVRSTHELGREYAERDPRVQLRLFSATAARGISTVSYTGGVVTSG